MSHERNHGHKSVGLLHEGLSDEPSPGRPAGIEIGLELLPTSDLPVMPPAYEGELEIHKRHLGGGEREVIELDSVGSAANRIEEVLQALKGADRYPLPISTTTIEPAAGEPITISTLEVPHRIFDAWIRLSDSLDGDGKFEDSDRGKEQRNGSDFGSPYRGRSPSANAGGFVEARRPWSTGPSARASPSANAGGFVEAPRWRAPTPPTPGYPRGTPGASLKGEYLKDNRRATLTTVGGGSVDEYGRQLGEGEKICFTVRLGLGPL